jgi:hypothetical protein
LGAPDAMMTMHGNPAIKFHRTVRNDLGCHVLPKSRRGYMFTGFFL